MAWVPQFKIRDITDTTTVYTFPAVQSHNLPKNPRDLIVVTSQRSKGGIVIDGGTKPFDAIIQFVLYDDSGSYQNLEALIDALEAAIPMNTPLILSYDKSPIATRTYKIKRVVDFDYPDIESDLRNYRQKVTATFLANAW